MIEKCNILSSQQIWTVAVYNRELVAWSVANVVPMCAAGEKLAACKM